MSHLSHTTHLYEVSSPYFRRLIIFLLVFTGITALFGGVGLLLTNGMGMPRTFLTNSPFTSFVFPALILFFIVGGSSMIAAYMYWKNSQCMYEAGATAGFALLFWIFIQTYLIPDRHPLQLIYFSIAVMILIMTLLQFSRL